MRRVRFSINGNNNKIFIDEGGYLHNVKIKIGLNDCPVNNCEVRIGKGCGANSLDILIGESNTKITIGDDLMASYGVEITCTDTHTITDLNNNIINKGESIEIGNHVWLGKNITIMKNTKIPNGCIVAQGSIVTKKFEKENCILAGIPAKIVKEDIIWHRERPERYTNEH